MNERRYAEKRTAFLLHIFGREVPCGRIDMRAVGVWAYSLDRRFLRFCEIRAGRAAGYSLEDLLNKQLVSACNLWYS